MSYFFTRKFVGIFFLLASFGKKGLNLPNSLDFELGLQISRIYYQGADFFNVLVRSFFYVSNRNRKMV